jgi:excisionase family DNA binding protein
MNMITPLLTSEEVAKYLNVEVITVRRLVKSGKLAAYRIGGEYRFSNDDLQTYLQASYQPAKDTKLERLGLFSLAHGQTNHLTQQAKNVLVIAGEETRNLHHTAVHFEHLLLGLIREREGIAAKVFAEHDIVFERVQEIVKSRLGVGAEETPDCLPLAQNVKQMMENAMAQAKKLRHNYVGTEHLLLAFLDAETDDLIRQIGTNSTILRENVVKLMTST